MLFMLVLAGAVGWFASILVLAALLKFLGNQMAEAFFKKFNLPAAARANLERVARLEAMRKAADNYRYSLMSLKDHQHRDGAPLIDALDALNALDAGKDRP